MGFGNMTGQKSRIIPFSIIQKILPYSVFTKTNRVSYGLERTKMGPINLMGQNSKNLHPDERQ
jgi:hypothetical protein